MVGSKSFVIQCAVDFISVLQVFVVFLDIITNSYFMS